MPETGVMSPSDGNESTNSGIGPMARTVSSLELWLRAQLLNSPWDSDFSCFPMPWDMVKAERPTQKLVIGVLWDDGVVHPTPPVSVRRDPFPSTNTSINLTRHSARLRR